MSTDAILQVLQRLEQQNRELLEKVSTLEARLGPPEPQYLPLKAAAKALGISACTLARWRDDSTLIQGVHWWPCTKSRPVYNVDLIADGQRVGFGSLPHNRACELWLKQQPSNQKRSGRK